MISVRHTVGLHAGGGAGTVIAAGPDQLDLQRGTEVTITSGAERQATAIGGAR